MASSNLSERVTEFRIDGYARWDSTFHVGADHVSVGLCLYESDGDGNREFHRDISTDSPPVLEAMRNAVEVGKSQVRTSGTLRAEQHGRDEVGRFKSDYEEVIWCTFSFQLLPGGNLSCEFSFQTKKS